MPDTHRTKEQKLGDELATLAEMSHADLRIAWQRLYRSQPPPRLSRDLMIRAVAYQIQERAFGGLKGPVKRKLKAAMKAFEKDATTKPPSSAKLQPGIRLVREWHGQQYDVLVLDNSFEFKGRSYHSLTAIAREITGAHWSGPRFFGLNKASKTAPQLAEVCHD